MLTRQTTSSQDGRARSGQLACIEPRKARCSPACTSPPEDPAQGDQEGREESDEGRGDQEEAQDGGGGGGDDNGNHDVFKRFSRDETASQ